MSMRLFKLRSSWCFKCAPSMVWSQRWVQVKAAQHLARLPFGARSGFTLSEDSSFRPPLVDPEHEADPLRMRDARSPAPAVESSGDPLKLLSLMRAFRKRGHLVACLDPLGRGLGPIAQGEATSDGIIVPDEGRDVFEFLQGYPDALYMDGVKVSPHQYLGLEQQDPAHQFRLAHESRWSLPSAYNPLRADKPMWTLGEVVHLLRGAYCQTVGWEINHILSKEKTYWLYDHIEGAPERVPLPSKHALLRRLIAAESLERFLATSFPATKRFGIEGCDALVPGLHAIMQRAVEQGVEHVQLGMAHRGRLNILVNILGKSPEMVFAEMDGRNSEFHVGDVKYHLGMSTALRFPPDGAASLPPHSHALTVGLTPNPSHLEAVNAVVTGQVYSQQVHMGDAHKSRAMGLLIHGDAAFSGLGITPEVMQLSKVPGYSTGGTVHIIVNNQIGFTTDPKRARSTPYPSDIAKAAGAPIFHVNADDPEAVVRVCKLAVDYRQRFRNDVVVDLVGYRRNGHNEQDDPTLTQPTSYRKIRSHPTCLEKYSAKLIEEGSVTAAQYDLWRQEAWKVWTEAFARKQSSKEAASHFLRSNITGEALGPEKATERPIEYTGLVLESLQYVGRRLCALPEHFTPHPHIQKLLEARRKMFTDAESRVDWATAEQLAFGTLLCHHEREDTVVAGPPSVPHVHVRLSGQDCSRGTFNQRHAVFYDQVTNKPHVPLQHVLPGHQDEFQVWDSPLSEAGVLGFEYGYSLLNPTTAVMWEAQFGDFANNAQVVIDQFIASAEEKWGQTSRLVLLLPHGYDGQGPDHSSARMERFLQLCNDDPDTLPGTAPKHRKLIESGYRALRAASNSDDASISRNGLLSFLHDFLADSLNTKGDEDLEGVPAIMDNLFNQMGAGEEGITEKQWERFMVQYIRRHFEKDANMFVVNVTTPAQYFHVLRMQMRRPFCKPLVVFTPKWLLHHRPCTSALKDFSTSAFFTRVIDDGKFSDNTRHLSHHPQTGEPYLLDAPAIRRVVMCTGQVYYRLSQLRRSRKIRDIVLVRLEMIAPFPHDRVTSIVSEYKNADLVWCQEEPKNMGAWAYVQPRINTAMRSMCESMGTGMVREVQYVGRAASAATATASPEIHAAEMLDLAENALMLDDV